VTHEPRGRSRLTALDHIAVRADGVAAGIDAALPCPEQCYLAPRSLPGGYGGAT